MGRYSEQELRYATPLAEALAFNPEFRAWALAGTRLGDMARDMQADPKAQLAKRSKGIKAAWWFNYFCGRDRRCLCRAETSIETDILIVFACTDGLSRALHVEVKRPGDRLSPGQAESYPRRAACWADPATRPRTVLAHHSALSLLACDRETARDPRTACFDGVLVHDDIALQLAPYPLD